MVDKDEVEDGRVEKFSRRCNNKKDKWEKG